MGYMSAGEDTGEMAGPILAGLLWSAFGAPALLVARMGLAIGAEVFTSRMTRDPEYEPAPTGPRSRGEPPSRAGVSRHRQARSRRRPRADPA